MRASAPDGRQASAFSAATRSRAHRAITQKVGYFSQKFSLYGDLSIDENIAFFAEIHGVAHYQDRRNRLLEMMQLTPFRDRLADRLSGGMKQKLALACTLVHEPEIILLDEPTTGVDPVSRREFWRLLSEFLSQGITIFMATPYLDEAERCSRVALMSEGRILALDEPNALRAAFPDDIIEVLASRAGRRRAGHPPRSRRARRPELRRAASRARAARRGGGRRGQAGRRLPRGARGRRRVRMIPASLEDVFIDRVVHDAGAECRMRHTSSRWKALLVTAGVLAAGAAGVRAASAQPPPAASPAAAAATEARPARSRCPPRCGSRWPTRSSGPCRPAIESEKRRRGRTRRPRRSPRARRPTCRRSA